MQTKHIDDFLEVQSSVQNHRYNSWNYCYDYFGQENIDKDIASLHLAFYLASWGMYRGSSFLLQRDYKFLTPVVEIILKYKELRDVEITKENQDFVKKLFVLVTEIRDYFFKQKFSDINKEQREASDTLITKIILGTLGITPAYDRYFVQGSSFKSFDENSMKEIIKFAVENEKIIKDYQQKFYLKFDILPPIMKIIDMYFWGFGKDFFDVRKIKNNKKTFRYILKEIYNEIEFNREYSEKEIFDRVNEKTAKYNVEFQKVTYTLQLHKHTVNATNRVHLGIKNPIDDTRNFFYFPNENNKKVVKKFSVNITDNPTIYFSVNGEKKSVKLYDIKRNSAIKPTVENYANKLWDDYYSRNF